MVMISCDNSSDNNGNNSYSADSADCDTNLHRFSLVSGSVPLLFLIMNIFTINYNNKYYCKCIKI